jgi:hypothetical protein
MLATAPPPANDAVASVLWLSMAAMAGVVKAVVNSNRAIIGKAFIKFFIGVGF